MRDRTLVALAMICALGAGPADRVAGQAPQLENTTLPLGRGIRRVAFSPDGKLLAACTGIPRDRGRVALWDLATRRLLWTREEDDGVPALAFAPDGKTLAIAVYDKTAEILDVASGAVKAKLRGHTMEVRGVAFSPDNKLLATGSWDRHVKLWSLPGGTLQKTLEGHPARVYTVAFAPDGKTLGVAGDQYAALWDLAAGRAQIELKGHGGSPITSIQFSRDGRWVVTGGWDSEARIWNAASGALAARFQARGSVEQATLSSDNRMLAVCGRDSAFELFEANLGPPGVAEQTKIDRLLVQLDDDRYEVREKAESELRALGYLAEPRLRQLLKKSGSVEVRLRLRRILTAMRSPSSTLLPGHTDALRTIAFAPGDKMLASGAMDGSIKLWDLQTHKEIASLRLPDGTPNLQR